MSGFLCILCDTEIIDTPEGFKTFCEHWPLEVPTPAPTQKELLDKLIEVFDD